MGDTYHARSCQCGVIWINHRLCLGAMSGAEIHCQLVAPHAGARCRNGPRWIAILGGERHVRATSSIAVCNAHHVAFASAVFEKPLYHVRQKSAANKAAERR